MAGKSLSAFWKKTGFEKLEQREKIIIVFGIFFVISFCILQFVITPYLDASRRLDASIENRKRDLRELKLLQQEYRLLKNETGGIRQQLAKRQANFSLFSFLDAKAADAKIKGFINYMKPSTAEREGELQESVVEMKFTGISLAQIVEYLQLIESPAQVVSIKRISIQESGDNNGLLDVVMQVATFIDKKV